MSPESTTRKAALIRVVVALISLAIGLYVTVSLLSGAEWNPSVLIKFPELRPEQLAYGEAMLGDVVPAGGDGHDGKYYFMQAMDPFYLEPEIHARTLDRPSYRAQRMLYPTVAGLFGALPPMATAWSLWVTNMVVLAIGGWLAARLAQELGLSGWFGLAFAFNPGVIVSGLIDTAEVMAMTLLVAGLLALMRQRYGAAALLLAGSALSRETMVIGALGAILYVWRTEGRVPRVLALPFVVPALWWVYVRLRIGYLDEGIQDLTAVGVPFKGFIDAIEFWMARPGSDADMLMGVVLLITSAMLVKGALRQPSLLAFVGAGFAILAVTMARDVWKFYFDASRALAPVITLYVMAVAASRRKTVFVPQSSPALATGPDTR